uniref:Abi family protein n=1 Tax=Paracoccus sp. TRP TaxID=412597 RepID=UPI000225F64E|nr:Abi family protein [Paracoccus sp. TRP]
MKFNKPATSINDQIALLRRRGMVVNDEATARHYLGHISYYRLRAYWLPFEVPAADGDHALTPGTRFEDVLALYVFDRQLRLMVMDAVERVEVAIRAQWAHHMAMTYGAHGYLDQAHYGHVTRHATAVADLTKEFRRSRDTFAEHYRKKYTAPKLPPVWMAAEVMSFGLLSKFLGDLKLRADRQAIARPFGLDEKVLTSFAHHMSHVRNICAHHGRLWNRRFTIRMAVPRSPARLAIALRGADDRYLHNTLVMLDHLLTIVAPDTEWRERLVDHLATCPLPTPAAMGFPADWQGRQAWRVQG